METREIERKYLIPDCPEDLSAYPGVRIIQGYLALAGDGTAVRIRQKGDRFFLTVKRGAGMVRDETEIPLSREQFETLWPLTEAKRVEKIRHEIPRGDTVIELDVYEGSLRGLITAEVEFRSVDASYRFVPPDWFGSEVTEDLRYTNARLALHGPPEGDPHT